MAVYIKGLMMGLAYVAPIGAQNLFVINSAIANKRKKALFFCPVFEMYMAGFIFNCRSITT